MNLQKINIKLVEEVEKRPILYNFTLQGYSRKDETERAWNEVGKTVNMTDVALGPDTAVKRVDKLNDMVLKFLNHYKNPDSLNMPLPIPDPMPIPDRSYPLVTTSVRTTNVNAYGVSRTRIDKFESDIVSLKVNFGVRMLRLQVTGNYSAYWFFTRYGGGFNVTIVEPYIDCEGKLEVTRNGELEVSEIKMEMQKHADIKLDFQNAGMLSAIVNNLGQLIFEGFKPYFFKIINNNVRGTINEYLKKLKMTFPNSIPPIDLAIAESRKMVRNMGYDPFFVPDYQYSSGIYSLDVTHITITGTSSFYRLGNISVNMDNRTVHTGVNVGTELLEGTCTWETGFAGILTKSGTASFTVDYIHVMSYVDQHLDISRKPKVVDLHVTVGNVQLRFDGLGTLDYLIEAAVNILPNIIRYQIIQIAEVPIKRKMQEVLNNLDIEQFIIKELPIIERHLTGNASNVVQDSFLEETGLVVGDNELDQDIEF